MKQLAIVQITNPLHSTEVFQAKTTRIHMYVCTYIHAYIHTYIISISMGNRLFFIVFFVICNLKKTGHLILALQWAITGLAPDLSEWWTMLEKNFPIGHLKQFYSRSTAWRRRKNALDENMVQQTVSSRAESLSHCKFLSWETFHEKCVEKAPRTFLAWNCETSR
jgi:hypothetical protein